MADKVALVRLRAQNQQYDTAMKNSAKATEAVGKAGEDASRKLAGGFDAKKVDEWGSKLTRNVTLPLVALGGVAVKSSGDINKVFTEMITLGGVAADQIDDLKSQVNDLAGETGRGPKELADGLLVITSAGYSSAAAMEILEASAKGAAIGLGTTDQIANAVTSVIYAYGAENITAAKAVDVLVASAQASKIEASELAPQLGRLLPIAKELGIGFDELAASVAATGSVSGDASLAATQVGGAMAKLLKPSRMAEDVLSSVGLTMDDVREKMGERGLVGTVQWLNDVLDDTQFNKFFEDQQAIQGALLLTDEKVQGIVDSVKDGEGALDNAFGTWAESAGAKNSKAFAEMQVALLQLGDALAPMATSLLQFAAAVARTFAELPAGAQAAIIAFAALAASAGPLMKAGVGISKSWAGAGKAFDALGKARASINAISETQGISKSTAAMQGLVGVLRSIPPGAAVAGMAMVAAGAIMYAMADDAKNAAQRSAELAAGIKSIKDEALSTGQTAEQVFTSKTLLEWFGSASDLVDKFKLDAKSLNAALTGTDEAFLKFVKSKTGEVDSPADIKLLANLTSLREQYTGATAATKTQKAAAADLGIATDDLAGATGEVSDAQAEAAGTADDLATAQDAVKSAYSDSESAADGVTSATESLSGARKTLASAEKGVASAQAGVADAQRGLAASQESYSEATIKAAEAGRKLGDALREQAEGSKELKSAQADVIVKQQAIVDSVIKVAEAEKTLAAAQADSKLAQEGVNEARLTAQERLDGLAQAVDRQGLSEREATLAVAEARERIADLDGESTGSERERAAIALQRAEWNLSDTLAENAKREAELKEQRALGVEGSDEMVEAKGRVESAAEAEKTAQDGVKTANEGVIEANAALVTSQEAVAAAHEQSAQRVVEAQKAVEDANKGVRDAADQVAASTRGIHEAQARVVEQRASVVEARAAVQKAEEDLTQAKVDQLLADEALRLASLAGKGALTDQIDEYLRLAGTLDPNSPLRARLMEMAQELADVEGTYNIDLVLGVTTGDIRIGEELSLASFEGSTGSRRFGGVDFAARSGKLLPHIAKSPSVMYGERETGGEAWVPKNGPAGIAMNTLSTAASWYGATVQPADSLSAGGMDASMIAAAIASAGRGGGSRVEPGAIVVNDASGNPMATAQFTSQMLAMELQTEVH